MDSNPLRAAIIGKAPASRDFAPFEDESWEIWTLSDLVPRQQVPRFNRHFELHHEWWWRPDAKRPNDCRVSPDYYDWLRSIDGQPVYMQQHYQDIPASRPFPLQGIVHHFRYPYYTNTVSYLIAFAIFEGAKSIGIWGVDMAQTVEYREQRPSCEWLIGWAMGAGIEVIIPDECDLLKTPCLYGYENESGLMARKWKARTQELQKRLAGKHQKLAQIDANRDQTIKEICFLEGAQESQQYYRQYVTEPATSMACGPRGDHEKHCSNTSPVE